MAPQLSEAQRNQLVGMRMAGASYRQIARKLGVSIGTAHYNVAKQSRLGTLANQKRRLSRLSSAKQDFELIDLARQHPRMSCQSMARLWSVPASRHTVWRRLNSAGFRLGNGAASCHTGASRWCKARLEWARQRLDWGDEEWSRILFTDETCFKLTDFTGRGRQWTMRKRRSNNLDGSDGDGDSAEVCAETTGETQLEEITSKKSRKSRIGKQQKRQDAEQPQLQQFPPVWIWAGIHLKGQTEVVFLDSLTSAAYAGLLKATVAPYCRQHLPAGCQLMDDNAPHHRTAEVADAKKQLELDSVPDWPARSPDLNPIENAWAMLKRRVRSRRADLHPPEPGRQGGPNDVVEKLKRIITEEWHRMCEDSCMANLVPSMQSRCQMVVNSNGGKTKY